MFNLDVQSSGFPVGGPSGPTTIPVTMSKLRWATLTVGKPDKVSVSAFGACSMHEAKFRWNMVMCALDFSTPNAVQNSELFNALEPTEKGGINFYLGMIFLKICAQDILDIPWLIHLHWMKENHALELLSGNSSPDLLGYSSQNACWNVFEAKGRNAGYSAAVLNKAKNQARRLIKVDGALCDLHVGSLLYRSKTQHLKFAWKDPAVSDREPFELETDRETWRQYYGASHELFETQEREAREFKEQMGFKIKIHKTTRKLIDAIFDEKDDYSSEFKAMREWSANRARGPAALWNGDGIAIYDGKDGF